VSAPSSEPRLAIIRTIAEHMAAARRAVRSVMAGWYTGEARDMHKGANAAMPRNARRPLEKKFTK
jgi:hypothetical protein